MNVADASSTTARLYTSTIRDLLPFYFVLLGVPAVGGSVVALGLLVVGTLLSRAGVLGEVTSVLQESAPISLDSASGEESPFLPGNEQSIDREAIGAILSDLPPLVDTTITLFGAVTALVTLISFSVVAAGRLHSVHALLTDEPATRRGVDGVFSSSITMCVLYTLEATLYILFPGVFSTLLIGLAVPQAAIAGLLLLLVLSSYPLVHLFFVFARSAVAVEDAGVVSSLSHSASFVRYNFFATAGYFCLGVIAVVGLLVAALVCSALQAPQVMALIVAFVFFPLMDTFRTLLYADSTLPTTHDRSREPTARHEPPTSDPESRRQEQGDHHPPDSRDPLESAPTNTGSPRDVPDSGEQIVVPARSTASIRSRLQQTVTTGWTELVAFTRGHLGLVGLNVCLFTAAVVLGWQLSAPIDGLFEASIERRIAGIFPPGTMANFFANNWAVGIRQAMAGFAFGVPTLVSLVQNGVLIGALFRFEIDPTALVAFLIPHGLVELPALWLSGALGLHLGRIGGGVVFGTVDRDALTEELDTAVDVLIGLGVLFAVAAVIEAFVSPYYWQPFF